MEYLTLYIDDIPVAELPFILPERDKALTRETNYRINRQVIETAKTELKEANKERINEARRGFHITVSLRSVFPKEETKADRSGENRKFDSLGNNFE